VDGRDGPGHDDWEGYAGKDRKHLSEARM